MTLVWWHNVTRGRGEALDNAGEFHSCTRTSRSRRSPSRTEFKTKIPIALASNSPPDVFQNWGGGGLVDQQKAGKVAISPSTSAVDQDHRRVGRRLAGER